MATTDINGMVFYTASDPVTPLQTNFNGISTAVTNALNGTTRTFRVANQAARDALLTARGASLASPLQVDRADTGLVERNTTGVIGGWKLVGSAIAFQYGSDVVTGAGGGLFTITFPTAFNAITTVVPSLGDNNGTAITAIWGVSQTTTTFTGRMVNTSGVGTNTVVRVNWVAIGR